MFLNGKNWGICSRFPQVLRTTAAPEPIHPPGGRGAKISKAARLQDHAPGKARENAENPTRARRRICRAPVSCLADTKGGGVTQYPPPDWWKYLPPLKDATPPPEDEQEEPPPVIDWGALLTDWEPFVMDWELPPWDWELPNVDDWALPPWDDVDLSPWDEIRAEPWDVPTWQ